MADELTVNQNTLSHTIKYATFIKKQQPCNQPGNLISIH